MDTHSTPDGRNEPAIPLVWPPVRPGPIVSPQVPQWRSLREPADPGPRRTRVFFVLAAVVLIVLVAALQRSESIVRVFKAVSGEVSGVVAPQDFGTDEVDLMGRMLVKLGHVMRELPQGRGGGNQSLAPLMQHLDSQMEQAPSRVDELRAAIVAGELVGAQAALERLRGEFSFEPDSDTSRDSPAGSPPGTPSADDSPVTESETATSDEAAPPDVESLRAILIRHYEGGLITPEERDNLQDQLGWFGRLAIGFGAPDTDPDRRGVLAGGWGLMALLVCFGLLVLGVAIAGLVVFILAILYLTGPKYRPAYMAPLPGGDAYLRVFVYFLGGFVVLALALSGVVALVEKRSPGFMPWVEPLGMLAHWFLLLAAATPLLLGVRKPGLRHALGWTRGRGVLREMGCGVVGYLATFPVFIGAVLVGIVLLFVQQLIDKAITGTEPEVSNALFDRLGGGGPWMILSFFFMATVWAPIVEETIFRGALFRHLSGRMPAILAAAVSAFVFGIIHPVPLGLTAPLMALGFGFAMIRRWRGSLIAPMTAHCLHNFTVLSFLLALLWLVD